jgi:hypothetical protein
VIISASVIHGGKECPSSGDGIAMREIFSCPSVNHAIHVLFSGWPAISGCPEESVAGSIDIGELWNRIKTQS